MGSCYSRKASGGSYSYTTVSMASTKQEEASRLARPTPYSRNNTLTGLNFKKKIPPLPTKQESHSSSLGSNRKLNICNTIGSGQQSNIPRLHSSISTSSGHLDTDGLESNRSYVDPNSNSTDDPHITNNNNNMVLDDSNIKQETGKSASAMRQGKRFLETVEGNDNFTFDGNKTYNNMTKQNSDAMKISLHSKIPSVSVAHITGLPRPQVAQISTQSMGKSTENITKQIQDDDSKQKLFQRSGRNIPKWQTKYESADISDGSNHISTDNHLDGDSYAAETWDSGLGSSINEKAKQEDAETLKDVEHFDSLEGSPVCQTKTNEFNTDVNKVVDAISVCHISSDNVKNREDGKKSIKLHNTSTPKYKNKGGFGYNKSDTDGTFSQKFLSGARENKLKNFSYDNQQTYAAYKSSLSYKRIPILKQYTDTSRKFDDLKKESSTSKDGSNIPRILRRTVSEGKKERYTNSRAYTCVTSLSKSAEADSSSKEVLSPESDEKSDSTSQGILSPVSELENREFLIDDEIADQPGLISFANAKIPSLKQSVNELHVLQAANSVDIPDDVESFSSKLIRDRSATEGRESLLSYSDFGSSSSSLASDDLMMDYEKSIDTVLEECESISSQTVTARKNSEKEKQQYRRSYPQVKEEKKPLYRRSSGSLVGNKSSVSRNDWRSRSTSLPLRPPRQMAVTGVEDGSMRLDASSYRLLRQDLNGMKTMLLKLKRILHEAETLNPFDPNPKNMFYHSLAHIDLPSGYLPNSESVEEQHSASEVTEVMQENTDLRRQLVLLQQQLEERERTVRLLQQQMTKYTKVVSEKDDETTNNAATQTERSRLWTNNLSHSSVDDTSNGTLVSSEINNAFDEHLEWTAREHSSLRNRMAELTRSLNSINESLQTSMQKPLFGYRSISSSSLHHST